MQATKIVIGKEYAVQCDGQLASLRVTKVTTTRTGAHASDFRHVITGVVNGQTLDYGPDGVLGPYEEHKVLVEAKQAEEAARKAEAARKLAAASALLDRLYRLVGRPRPDAKTSGYHDPFRTQYDRGVEINADGVALLLEALTRDELQDRGNIVTLR